jgi:hypothetical protein
MFGFARRQSTKAAIASQFDPGLAAGETKGFNLERVLGGLDQVAIMPVVLLANGEIFAIDAPDHNGKAVAIPGELIRRHEDVEPSQPFDRHIKRLEGAISEKGLDGLDLAATSFGREALIMNDHGCRRRVQPFEASSEL